MDVDDIITREQDILSRPIRAGDHHVMHAEGKSYCHVFIYTTDLELPLPMNDGSRVQRQRRLATYKMDGTPVSSVILETTYVHADDQ